MNRKIILLSVLGLLLLACLLACGYFGAKTIQRARLHQEAMAAYENKDYVQAERLLQAYVQLDPDAEAEHVALAEIYHEFGNTGMEAQMWQKASSLNPLNSDYRENMLTSAMKSASYPLLHGILGRKAWTDEKFTDQELYLYVISSYRSGYPKDGDNAYKKAVAADPEAFHKSELGLLAEFMANYSKYSETERDVFLNRPLQSEDPVIRFEALYTAIVCTAQRNDEADDPKEERLLKEAAATNPFAGTPLLADYYFLKFRFGDVIDVLGPYLRTIDDTSLYLLYLDSCVFEGKLDEIKALKKKFPQKSGTLKLLSDYCEILIAYMENDEKRLAVAVRKSAKLIDSPLSRFIRLRVAMANESFNEILTVAQEIFSNPPFYDLHNRALLICLDYIVREMKKPENRKDPSQMAELARVLSWYLQGDQLLTEIILVDQYKKDLANGSDLLAAIAQFPNDELLQKITAEYLIFDEKAEQAMPIIEQLRDAEKMLNRQPDRGIQILFMLALDQIGEHDEAAAAFRDLVEQSNFEPELLAQFFQSCVRNERTADLDSMANKLDATKDVKLERFGVFFRAAAMILTGDEEKMNEALDLLASTPDDDPDFTFYAANRLFEHDRLDEAEAKYNAIRKTYRTPSLVFANLSRLYHARGDAAKALDSAKEAFTLEKESILPAFIYAKRLAEAERYQEAVEALKFPRHAVNYRKDIIELWTECMKHVIEKSLSDRKFIQAEGQCRHLLIIVPDDEFGKETLEKIRKVLNTRIDSKDEDTEKTVPAPAS